MVAPTSELKWAASSLEPLVPAWQAPGHTAGALSISVPPSRCSPTPDHEGLPPTPGRCASVTANEESIDAIAAKGYRFITLTLLSFGLYWYLITWSSFWDSRRTTRDRPPATFSVW